MSSLPAYVYAAAFFGAFLGAGLSLPWWRRWCQRVGVVDEPGERKIHHQAIPLAGGLAVLTGFLLPLAGGALAACLNLLPAEVAEKIRYGFSQRWAPLLVMVGGAVAMGGLGWLDDVYELRPGQKFAGQCVVAVVASCMGERITLFIPNFLVQVVLTTFWLVAVTNAFNLSDNMNGLCAGLAAVAAIFFALQGLWHGYYLVALVSLAAAGAALGFLPFNYPQATAFLGDSGSHGLGFLMASLAIVPHYYAPEHSHRLAVLSPLLVLAVPLVDMAFVVVSRLARGQPFYQGDNRHLSHRLAQKTGHRATAVAILWGGAVLGGMAAVALW
ncbi:MraY family glycosyltransferase [Fontisphaera persica]|uniref:glycosyltransferase family 4 protein n=1 Tax=Fontisphaera persica TaxID=2974023 RepID=UPI0024BFBADD|nr:MraY family glycosyltransferase [Fontisphaera persica]WCJ60832.1 MraY family glycosyltransferase [Fontisphaera persica]